VGTDRATVDAVLTGAWRRASGVHGEEHWRCVAATGLALADGLPGCDRQVVFLFGLLHDTRRVNEHVDPEHGPRAAAWARELAAAGALPIGADRLEVLGHAIAEHTNGLVSDDPTVGACWDADRLHLPRVSIDPDPARFSTAHAHGPEPLREAALLRRSPPTWDALLALMWV
jgi:uncharacterized protein